MVRGTQRQYLIARYCVRLSTLWVRNIFTEQLENFKTNFSLKGFFQNKLDIFKTKFSLKRFFQNKLDKRSSEATSKQISVPLSFVSLVYYSVLREGEQITNRFRYYMKWDRERARRSLALSYFTLSSIYTFKYPKA